MADIQLGDVPGWIGAGTGVAALFRGLSNRRQAQFRDWGELLAELSDLELQELRHLVEDNPFVAEIVSLAWEEAARTASDDKRYLLAQVAAAALRGSTTPDQVEALQFLLRTVTALDPPHVTMLVIIGTAENEATQANDTQETRATRADLEARWPSPSDLMDPALATLEREALVEGALGYDGKRRTWRLRPYGRRFLDFLLVDAGGWPPIARDSDGPMPAGPE
jgi:hypothetical protein